jgi:putative spermidine/putrescine transport system substrate-binding protein
VALVWANYGQQQLKSLQKAGAHVAYVNPSEGALSWLDNWAMTSGVKDKAAAEKWVNFLLQKKIGQALTDRTGFGNTVVPSGSAKESDTLVWIDPVEDPLKRSDLWNEVKAAP